MHRINPSYTLGAAPGALRLLVDLSYLSAEIESLSALIAFVLINRHFETSLIGAMLKY
jgi:hypothetical protein